MTESISMLFDKVAEMLLPQEQKTMRSPGFLKPTLHFEKNVKLFAKKFKRSFSKSKKLQVITKIRLAGKLPSH